ncbi:Carbon-nitrogen hydrolase [Penicillium atrosanguineum]|uniref:Carbon-nitrogen hydrolase n=2 Tax=Penicillium atrosanguineum TaxID=1132637 RepID=A0A9W9PUK4_9EURO|nr:Carbon-nitrogen hydrolase [Penicillium atrosanguineum]KAJ5145233.1 Carbon-nitrogen hydrolase [Penicillium atrosanguineum]KAJ5311672.1 Carbon-nitrogen hydrolase [Penicillium atrosanguineum]
MTSEFETARPVTVAACQLGPVHLADSREDVLKRMFSLLDQAAKEGVKLAVFPELAFTTFFPRYLLEGEDLDQYFETEDPTKGGIEQSPTIKPLFDHARSLGIDVYAGYAERSLQKDGVHVDYNSSVYYSSQEDKVIAKYRKVHLPGTVEPRTESGAYQQLEKRYFRPGNIGFPAFRAPGLVEGALKKSDGIENLDTTGKGDPIVGMLICNDRRWPEAWRVYGLQGMEIMCCGYNTTAFPTTSSGHMVEMSLEAAEEQVMLHHKLSCQGNSYMNACFSINVAKTGAEDGNPLVGGTMIVHPLGYIIKEANTKEDELVVATIDLADCRRPKNTVFAFEKHRRPEHYNLILEQTGVVEPELL